MSGSGGGDSFLLTTLYCLPSMGRTSMLSILSSAVWPSHVPLVLHLELMLGERACPQEWGGMFVQVADKLLVRILG